jgi:hypothetical protein
MKRGYYLEDGEVGRVKIYLNDKEADIFTYKDTEYLEGRTRKRPLDLSLHIAIYILNCEGLPEHILEQVKQWVKEHPVAGSQVATLFYMKDRV